MYSWIQEVHDIIAILATNCRNPLRPSPHDDGSLWIILKPSSEFTVSNILWSLAKCALYLSHLLLILQVVERSPESLGYHFQADLYLGCVLLPGTVSVGLAARRRCSRLTTCRWSLCNAWRRGGSPGPCSTGWPPPGSCARPGQAPPLWNGIRFYKDNLILLCGRHKNRIVWVTLCCLNPGRLFVIMIYLTRPSLDDLSKGGSYFCVKLPFVIEQMLDPAFHEWVF